MVPPMLLPTVTVAVVWPVVVVVGVVAIFETTPFFDATAERPMRPCFALMIFTSEPRITFFFMFCVDGFVYGKSGEMRSVYMIKLDHCRIWGWGRHKEAHMDLPKFREGT